MDPLHHSDSNPIRKFPSITEQPDGATYLSMIKEHCNESDDTIRKQYENMSYDEMSLRIAENYKQLSGILETQDMTPSSSGKTHSVEDNQMEEGDDDSLDAQQIADSDLDESTKKRKVAKLFWRAASSGDSNQVLALIRNDTLKTLVDIDAKDEDGTTPLIYAACFGKTDIAQILLSSGAKMDIQDSFGWSALMWATNNNHEQIVKLLLENGASSQTKSSKGRTVFDFVNTENQKIVDILTTNPRDSLSSTSSIFDRNNGSLSSSSSLSHTGDNDFYYQSTLEGYDSFMTEEADRRKKLLKAAMHIGGTGNDDHGDLDDSTLNQYDDDDDDISNDFQWDKCLPDQMFVFGADDLPYILDTIITSIQLPMSSQHEICLPANVIFLCARFAHYFSTEELLNQVLNGAVERISNAIKTNTRNIHVLAFWITNLTQLLHYLKKDGSLVVAAANHQLQLSELISETYMALINDSEQRITKILGPAMLDHEEIPGMDQVKFTDDWQRFFRRNSRRSMVVPPGGALATQIKRQTSQPTNATNGNSTTTTSGSDSVTATKTDSINSKISPQSITDLLSSTLFVLQSYDVHPAIIVQALAQFFHYMSCELFNRILTNKKLLCRSKAMQIRMNLSQLEDWISTNNMPINLGSYMSVTAQLLQLLQCLTQLTDLVSFINTVTTFDTLNALQVKRCVINYRYEVNEPRLPEEIEKYAMQLAEDTVRHQQTRNHQHQSIPSTTTPPPLPKKRPLLRSMSRSSQQSLTMQRTNSSRRESMSHLVGSLMSSMGISTSADSTLQQHPNDNVSPLSLDDMDITENQHIKELDDDDGDHKDIEETRDSKFMLPFSVPTSASVAQQQHSKHEHPLKERVRVPVIPEYWMNKLDHGHTSI